MPLPFLYQLISILIFLPFILNITEKALFVVLSIFCQAQLILSFCFTGTIFIILGCLFVLFHSDSPFLSSLVHIYIFFGLFRALLILLFTTVLLFLPIPSF